MQSADFYHFRSSLQDESLSRLLSRMILPKSVLPHPGGSKRALFFEAINNCGLGRLVEIFADLVQQAGNILPAHAAHFDQWQDFQGCT
jgi:hypothetical protein